MQGNCNPWAVNRETDSKSLQVTKSRYATQIRDNSLQAAVPKTPAHQKQHRKKENKLI